ncbi:MAG: penicillin acylase family protein [Aggregatilineales bacterium]
MRTLRRIVLIVVVILVIIAGAGAGYVTYTLRRPLPQLSGTLNMPGLDGQVTIYRDAQGVPQIYATTTHDLFFAQGYVQAQDRWWQMEFNRHIGQGRISELVGQNDAALSTDTFIRTVGWNRASQTILASMPADTKAPLQAYSDGINAYISAKSGPDLAIEYSLLALNGVHIPIEPWQPTDTIGFGIAQAWSLSLNMDEEINRVELYKQLGANGQDWIDQFFIPPYPYDKKPTVLNAGDLPSELGGTTLMAPNISKIDWSNVQTQLVGNISPTFKPFLGNGPGVGSNNWVVSGKLTQSGKPLLANDPHIDIAMPAVWYESGLHCVTLSDACPYNVEGFSFPGAPGIVIGHNQRIAWGVTNVGPNTEELYAIKPDANDDTKYQLDGKTESMQVINETIKFGDGTPAKTIRVRVTNFGPIVSDTGTGRSLKEPLALRWAAIDPKSPNDLLGSVLAIDRATDWQTFRTALTRWGSPSQNFVFADVDGNIGYQMPGLIPIRAHGDTGLVPADGSTMQNDWKGYVPFDDLPSVYNPARGYIVTANNAVVPPAYFDWLAKQLSGQFGADSNYVFTRSWDYDFGYRSGRITDLINATAKHTIDTFKAIQGDFMDNGAKDILPFALKLDYGSDVPKAVVDWMSNWDYQMHIDSGQAALYADFWVQLVDRVWKSRIGYAPDGPNIVLGMRLLMDQPDHALWRDPTASDKAQTRDDVVRAAFVAGYQDMVKQLGADYTKWQWGDIHKTTWVSNPLGQSGVAVIENYVNIGPLPVNGSNETISVSHWSADNPFNMAGGGISSMRMILDLSDFNHSQWIIPTGQSGHPASPHYTDMNQQWRTVQYNPMVSDDSAIKAAAVDTLILQKTPG